ncbi:MAG TPA: hypothetical protein VKR21_18080 [Solirubrobacteraceae bacterium]|nr:hypothetical protein [Solirubrobacteraceae bacterium]
MLVFGRAYPKPAGPGVDVAAAYTPATGTWMLLSPLTGPRENAQGSYHALWTGKQMLVFGPFDFQAFDPAGNRWRRLAPPPRAVDGAGLVVWTGHEMIHWGGGCCGDAFSTGWAYRPLTNTWRKLPASPLAPSSTPNGVWTGRELVVVESGLSPEGAPYPAHFARAAAYDPKTNRWRRIAALPGHRVGERAFWDGREVLLVAVGTPQIGRPPSPARRFFAYSPRANRWRELAPLPSGRRLFASVWDGKRLLVWGGTTTATNTPQNPPTGAAYDPRTNRWSVLPRSSIHARLGPTAVWTGRSMIVWGGWTIGTRCFTDGAAFTPTAP